MMWAGGIQVESGEAPSIEEVGLGSQGVSLQGKDLEEGELHKERISEVCTGSRCSHQLSADQHKHVRKLPEARERTT